MNLKKGIMASLTILMGLYSDQYFLNYFMYFK